MKNAPDKIIGGSFFGVFLEGCGVFFVFSSLRISP